MTRISALVRRAYKELIGFAGALRFFRAAAGEAFDFLIKEFGFEPMSFQELGYGAVCRFENATTIVELHLDWTEEFIYVYVRPSAGSPARDAIPAPGVLLDAIMIHRGERPEKQEHVLKRARMEKALHDYARGLRADAEEALRGDFRELILIRRVRPEATWRLLGPMKTDLAPEHPRLALGRHDCSPAARPRRAAVSQGAAITRNLITNQVT